MKSWAFCLQREATTNPELKLSAVSFLRSQTFAPMILGIMFAEEKHYTREFLWFVWQF